MKKKLIGLLFVLVSFVSFGQKQRTTAMFDADTTTRPKAGFYGVGVRNGKVYVVKPTGNTERLVAANSHVGTSGQVLYSNGTVNYFKTLTAADIVGFGGGLGTNYLPKWNGSGFVNSLAFDNGTNFSIGTNTGIDSYSRLYVFGGTNGANIDARPGGGGYDQSIVDLQGSDYATNFNSAHLRYQGVGAVGTTLGYSNANLADLTYNYAGSNRAFLIRSVGQSPIVFGVDNAIKGKFNTTGLNLENLTASNVLASDSSKNVVSLSTATYPSLTELSYVKGLTSAVQTQLNAKESALTFSSPLSRSTNTISIPAATTSVSGHLTSTDWNTFNGKFATPSGLTTNYLPKWNGSGFGNSGIFESGGNVGIGTASPSGILHATTSTLGATSYSYFYGNAGAVLPVNTAGMALAWNYSNGGGESVMVSNRGAGNIGGFMFIDNNAGSPTTIMTLRGSGNVGIGTTAPTRKLEVKNSSGNNQSLTLMNNDFAAGTTGTSMQFATGAATGNTYYKLQVLNSGESGAGNIVLQSDGGNVGVGTVSPNSKLEVTGNIGMSPNAGSSRYLFIPTATNTYTGQLHIQSGAGSDGFGGALNMYGHSHATKPGWVTAGISVGSGTVGTSNEGRFTVNTTALGGGTDLFTVLRSGNVGINTTAPTSKLQVVGLPTYADNAAATSAGLTAGAFYRTSTGVLMVVY